MTRTRKTICTLMCLAFFAVLAVMPGSFILQKNVYRQLPLFRFLERKAARDFQRKDPDTYAKIVENHTESLGAMVEKENEEVRDEQEKETDKQAEKDSAKETEKSQQDKTATATPEVTQTILASNNIQPAPRIDLSPQTLADYDYLMNQFFIVDSQTTTNADQLNAAELLGEDLTIQKDATKPQILLYHTHSQEAFADSREGAVEDTIIGVGNYLTELLTKNYGYQVIHVTEAFDMESGELDRSAAYDYAGTYLETILEENPSIEVVIDLHRDGVPENRHWTELYDRERKPYLSAKSIHSGEPGIFVPDGIPGGTVLSGFLQRHLPRRLPLQPSLTSKIRPRRSRSPDQYCSGSKKRHGALRRYSEPRTARLKMES